MWSLAYVDKWWDSFLMFGKYFCEPNDSCVLLLVKNSRYRIRMHGMENIKNETLLG